jgi:triphosphatase
MRRSLKKLRYLTEFVAPVFPAKAVKPFLKQLKNLQDVFGYVNDVRMAEQLLAITSGRHVESCAAAAAGIILGAHQVKAAEAWTHAQEEWHKLKKSQRFWE